MSNEIKEILDNVKKCCDITKDQSFTVYQRQDILALLDYITNLQEENERLEEENNKFNSHIQSQGELISVLRDMKNIDYKSRCEKAIPMLKELNKKLKDILHIGIDIAEITDIENTLTGGDKE